MSTGMDQQRTSDASPDVPGEKAHSYAEEGVDPELPRHQFEVKELYLSGGGRRASLCAIGCVGYFVQTGSWQAIDEVVSVSGGSIVNGALVADQLRSEGEDDPSGDEATMAALANTLTRLTDPANHPLWSIGGIAQLAAMLVGIGGVLAIVAALTMADRFQPWLTLVAGLLFVPAVLMVIRRWLAAVIARAVRIGLGAADQQRVSTRGVRDHVVVAASLATREPRFFIWHRKETESRWQADPALSIYKAVRASCSVPLTAVERHSSALHGSEVLADAGWAGKFGEQWRAGLFQESEQFSVRRAFIALDAGTHESASPERLRWLGRVSVIWRLYQWLATSNEAMYHNDLWDLSDGLVRVCEEVSTSGKDEVRKLNVLRSRTRALSNFDRSVGGAAAAVAAGFLSTAVALEGPDIDHRARLVKLGELLDQAREIEGSAPLHWSVVLETIWQEA